MVEIRRSTPMEDEYLQVFFKRYGFEYQNGAITFVVDENNNIIGSSQLKIEDGLAEIISIVVQENNKGNGFGDGLLKMMINFCHNQNIRYIKVKKNKASDFFKRSGFIEKGDHLILDVESFYINFRCRGC